MQYSLPKLNIIKHIYKHEYILTDPGEYKYYVREKEMSLLATFYKCAAVLKVPLK
jgi:hypothetical protein